MPNVKKQALLPSGEGNGLAPIAGELVAEGLNLKPPRLRAVIAIVDCKRVGHDSDTGDEEATVRFRRVEVLLTADLGAAEKLIRRSLEARSDQTTLPLELEDEIREAFEQMREPTSPDDPDEKGKGKGGSK